MTTCIQVFINSSKIFPFSAPLKIWRSRSVPCSPSGKSGPEGSRASTIYQSRLNFHPHFQAEGELEEAFYDSWSWIPLDWIGDPKPPRGQSIRLPALICWYIRSEFVRGSVYCPNRQAFNRVCSLLFTVSVSDVHPMPSMSLRSDSVL